VTEESLAALVSQHGPVAEVRLRLDRASREPSRFAFVTMVSADDVPSAIFGLNGREVGGREIRVKQSRPPGGPVEEYPRTGDGSSLRRRHGFAGRYS
jgi:RNA recognition motif-containing protein